MKRARISMLVLGLSGLLALGCSDDDDGDSPAPGAGGSAAGTGGSGATTGGGTSGEGGGANAGAGGEGDGPYAAHGVVQKGPFNRASSMTIQELDGALDGTGRSFNTKTKDNFGSFELPEALRSPLIEIVAEGYYYDEVAGASSLSPLTLRGYSTLGTNEVVNVNVLTDLAGSRLAHLVDEGATFADAETQARSEMLEVFNIQEETGSFDDMDIAAAGDDNAILLAASVVMQQMATSNADSPATVVAELSARLAAIGADLETDGVLDDVGLKQDLLDAGVALDLAAVRGNLEARFDELGSGTVPAFEDYVDSDGDGSLNMHDYSLAFPTGITTELAADVTSEELEIRISDGSTQTASVSGGTIVLNGVDTDETTALVEDGDSLAIKVTSAAQDLDFVTAVTAEVTVGKNSGSFTVETHFVPQATLYRSVPGDRLGAGLTFAGTDIMGLGTVPLPENYQGAGTLLRFSGDDGAVQLENASYYPQIDLTLRGPLVWHSGEVLTSTSDLGTGNVGAVLLLNATTGAVVRTFPNPAGKSSSSYGWAYAATDSLVAISDVDYDEAKVYLFNRATGARLLTIDEDPTNAAGSFGASLAIVGDELIIADVARAAERRSLVEIRGLDGTLRRTLEDPLPPHGNSCFGCAMAVGGGYVFVGDPHFHTNGLEFSGIVHVYDAATGLRLHSVESPVPQARAFFGQQLAVEGNNLLVGAPEQNSGGVDHAGVAFLFDVNTSRVRFMYPNPEPLPGAQNVYGALAMKDGRIAIGSQRASPGGVHEAGAIYLFEATRGLIVP